MTVEHTERKLARIVLIDSLHPIDGADRIELAMVGGWQVVVQKGLYVPGSKAVYFEIDSLLPLDYPAFASMSSLSSKLQFVIDGKQYVRIKTMKLRKQLSQGFCIPLQDAGIVTVSSVKVDDDMTKKLGIIKYEAQAEKDSIAGGTGVKTGTSALGFPRFIPKTDQTRLQNIPVQFAQARDKGELFEKSFKLDGSSLTVFMKDKVLGCASRNVGFRLQTQNKGFVQVLKDYVQRVKQRGSLFVKVATQYKADDNHFTQAARDSGAFTALVLAGKNIAIQGELVGPAIQKNFEGVDKNTFFVYDVYDIDAQAYLLPQARQEFCDRHQLQHVPLGSPHAVTLPVDVEAALVDADGPSGLNGKYREGFVYKSMSRDFSFKVVSNTYLLKEE
jgi:RNA ligase (TIGR02306 family)